MSEIEVRIVRENALDVEISVSGALDDKNTKINQVILSPTNFRHVKLNHVVRFIESGLVIKLFWEHTDVHSLIVPLEGYGHIDIEKLGSLSNSKDQGFTGNIIMTVDKKDKGHKHFKLLLEFSKLER